MQHSGESYDRLAWLYDAAANLYSGGQIHALKASQISELQPGGRILYAGVGGGEDAVLAANHHVALTVLDASPAMLERAAVKFRAAGAEDSIEVICSDVLEHERPAYYDVVVANFFLNIFTEPTMKIVLAHLARMVKPGGKLLIGDFSHPKGRLTARTLQRMYYSLSMFTFWLFGGTPLHPIYDYPQYFAAVDLQTRSVRQFRVNALFPVSFEAITAEKM
ncbi:MAG: methyltransferase domain-containing protein [Hyphomicrobium sp.]|uniref:class I SAM-dependent methyltransferase n=1 Tax=Hyphomicrobium sp. TaxID=82 RepID=UPI00132C4061|nr:methyltransferase domain-containing protein [Hyphomicrobium sp.]KAB2942276.1 MAG: methyltransferase domain-containing protein [Hyphomicrobium sp.]MBZ0208419.1 methyltransferase domain-containing protein [Hyphomicrobium sp.]MCZ7595584.1 methyltransferase domain-containing protein [Hyphomicrobium sp.]